MENLSLQKSIIDYGEKQFQNYQNTQGKDGTE